MITEKTKLEEIATRAAFGEALVEEGEKNSQIVVLNCDLSGATGTKAFVKRFPERSFEFGIAEQNAVSAAAGLAMEGFRPFVSSFGAFITRRAYDQITISAAYSKAPVVIVGTHSGLAIGKDGATQMGINDLSVMLGISNIEVFQPADFLEAKQITEYLAKSNNMAYLRLSRRPQALALPLDYKFKPILSQTIKQGNDIALFATGDCVYHSLKSAEDLEKQGISTAVINVSTLKPFDEQTVLDYAEKTKALVTVEDHSTLGGLGSLVADVLAEKGIGKKLLKIGIKNSFGESGSPEDLYKKYGLDQEGIINSVRRLCYSL